MSTIEHDLWEAFQKQRITALRLALKMVELVPDGTPLKDVREYVRSLQDVEKMTPSALLRFIDDTERELRAEYARKGRVFKL